jgi:hypothetical protein
MLRHKDTGVLFFQAGSVPPGYRPRIDVSGGWVFRREPWPTYPQPATTRWLDQHFPHRQIAYGLILGTHAKLHREIDSYHGGKKRQAKFVTLYFCNANKKPAQAVSRLSGCLAG